MKSYSLTRGMLTSDTYHNILAVRNLSIVSDFKRLISRGSKKILDITTNYMKSSSLSCDSATQMQQGGGNRLLLFI